MLEAKNLSVYYAKRPIISDISFKLERGSFTALVGINGSGKSTLVRAINGALEYTGSLAFEGVELKDMPPKTRALNISVLPQQLGAPAITVFELALFGRSPHTGPFGRPSKKDYEAAERALKSLGIWLLKHRRLNELSGGERQKAFLAMVIAQDTPLVVLDEPATFMDMAYEKRFLNQLYSLKGQHKTVLCVMHNLNAAIEFADNFLVLNCGRLVFSGSRNQFIDSPVLEQVFGVSRFYTQSGRVFFG